jgi:hypothetical protein
VGDVQRLSEWFESGALLRPAAGHPCTVDLIRALAHLCGAPSYAADAGALRVAEQVGEAEHLLFVLVDGLGMNLVDELSEGSFFRQRLGAELRSVFPSATASAITAIATGDWPARHGVPGWWTYFPEHDLTAVSLPFLERFEGTPLRQLGIEASSVYPLPSILDAFARDTHCFQPARISDSAYSDYFRGQATPNGGYDGLADGIERVAQRIEAAQVPTYTYLYIPTLDEAQHAYGPRSAEVAAHLLELEAALEALHARLAGKARLVVSADHGLVRVPDEHKHVLLADDPLLALLAHPPSGEPRAPLFHVKQGQQASFRTAFQERFGERYALLDAAAVGELGLLGPGELGAQTAARIGDFLALAKGPDVLLTRLGERPSSTELMVGHHGGLLPDEVRVPLILA